MICIPPLPSAQELNRPPEDEPFESRDAKARRRALGQRRPSLLAEIEAESLRPRDATELQRRLAERQQRSFSTWEGFPSYGAGLGALLALMLIALYALITVTPRGDHPAPAESECELEYSPHLPLPFRYYPSCD